MGRCCLPDLSCLATYIGNVPRAPICLRQGWYPHHHSSDSECLGVLRWSEIVAVDSSATKAIERAAAIESSNYPMLHAIWLPLLNHVRLLSPARMIHT